jgi:hypothetical protein
MDRVALSHMLYYVSFYGKEISYSSILKNVAK